MTTRLARLLQLAEHAALVFCAYQLWRHVRRAGLKSVLTKAALGAVKLFPGGAAMVAKEQQKAVDDIRSFTSESMGEHDEFGDLLQLPPHGWAEDKLFPALVKLRGAEKDFREGKAFGGIYCDDKKLKAAINRAYCEFSDSNGLFPNVFPALKKFEIDVVRMTVGLLHGGNAVQGVLTTGGSESILLALKAYKERGAARGIEDPEAIIPISAHPAFAKACNYFGIKFVAAQTRPDGRVDVDDVRRLITSNTIVIVGSAPSFASGAIDPIGALGRLALQHKIGLHVDLCLGGFLLPFLERRGHLKNTEYDFRTPGVSSMSADLHKYGFGPKGTSVLLFETAELREQMFFAWTEWSGGQYCSPSMTGSRAGGIIAAAWATMMLLGEDGYTRLADDCWTAFVAFRDGIRAIKGFRLVGEPEAACIAFQCSEGPENKIYQVAAAMKKHFGWSANYFQRPIAVGIQVGARHNVDPAQYCRDLAASLELVEKNPNDYSGGLTQIYGMAANLGDRSVVGSLLKSFLTATYDKTPSAHVAAGAHK
jgi:sphinganine-1-phosphate aldolase